jgi:hypothetical protein
VLPGSRYERANKVTGVASYAVFGEIQARKKALTKAITTLATLKAGKATVTEEVVRKQLSANSSYQDNSKVNTHLLIQGEDIPLNIRIVGYWKEYKTQKVWVLVEDLDI